MGYIDIVLKEMVDSFNPLKQDRLKGLDIPKEYALIQKKKCEHSAMIRRLIIYRYEKAQVEANLRFRQKRVVK